MKLVVISTGLNTPADARARCLTSVATQIGISDVEHAVIDAETEQPPIAHFEAMTREIAKLAADDIVVSLDLDDWLLRPDALAIVKREHEAGAWATYGSFRFADGRAGFASQVEPGEDVRRSPWKMSHLKTYRAGIFNRIRREDLQIDGHWLPLARDVAVMLPVYEMSGPGRCRFLANDLYAYNLANAGEWKGGKAYRDEERRCVEYVRSLRPYERVAAL